MNHQNSFPAMLIDGYQKHGDRKVAMRKKNLGIWREYTWKDYYENVKLLSLGLLSLGFNNHDKLAIIGDNSPEWFWAELAAQAAGGVAVGIFTDSSSDEIRFVLNNSGSKMVVVKDQEQVDKVLSIKDNLPNISNIIYWDDKGLRSYDDPILISFREVQKLGATLDHRQPGCFEQNIEQVDFDDIAIISYTSGTTGNMKGVVCTYRNLVAGSEAVAAYCSFFDGDEYVSFISPAWITEQSWGIAGNMLYGTIVNFPEEPDTVQEDLREISPHLLLYSSTIWEDIISSIQGKIADAHVIKRSVYRLLLPIGYRMADARLQGRSPGFLWRCLNIPAFFLLFRPLRDRFGILKTRLAFTAGASLGPDSFRFLHAIGLQIRQIYGTTETGVATLHPADMIRADTVGIPPPGIELKISEEGEILVRSDSVFVGYHENPDATRKVLVDGWMYTGDAGYINKEGHLIYLDRLKYLKTLAGGTKFSPTYIEDRLKFSAYIRAAMAIGGEERPFVGALINIRFDTVSRWAEEHKIPYTTFVDLSQKPEVYDLIQKDIERVNQNLPTEVRVKKFVNLYKEFDADEAELTRTRKLKRPAIEERFRVLIEAIYDGREEALVEAEVTYRDGRVGKVVTSVKVRSIEN